MDLTLIELKNDLTRRLMTALKSRFLLLKNQMDIFSHKIIMIADQFAIQEVKFFCGVFWYVLGVH